MTFRDRNHQHKIIELESIWNSLSRLSIFAHAHGIEDIFQDNGAKVLQQLIYLNFTIIPGREGHDARSEDNREWEMKSINLETSATGFSTNHHTTHDIINNYRNARWSFAIYRGITLEEIYVMSPQTLEPIFQQWEEQLATGRDHLNNPKISVTFVRENGVKVFPFDENNPFDPQDID